MRKSDGLRQKVKEIHDNGNTFQVICEQLEELGYKYTYRVLNPMEHGNIPQNRERIYIVAFKDQQDYDRFIWPAKTPLGSAGESDLRIKDSTLPQISDPDILIQIFRHGDSYGAVRKKLCLWAAWFFVIDNATELWYNMK